MPFGLLSTGFVKKSLSDVRSELEAAFRAEFGASISVDPRSRNGQLIGIFAERLAELWDLAQGIDASFTPDMASGAQLDNLAALTGTVRLAATKSQLTNTVYLSGTTGTAIAIGKQASVLVTGEKFENTIAKVLVAAPAWAVGVARAVGSVVKNGGNVYVCIVAGVSAGAGPGPTGTGGAIVDGTATWAFVGTGDGYHFTSFDAVETGPILANAGTLRTIETPVSGWTGLYNISDATVVGRNLETDTELRVRREDELHAAANAALESIRSAVLAVKNVTSAQVLENVTDATVDGIPPHSVEVLVENGANADIAAALLAVVAGGIRTHGTTLQLPADSEGTLHEIRFTRPTVVNVWVRVDVVVDATKFPADGAQQIEDQIIAWGDAQKTGKDVVSSAIVAAAFKVPGVLDVPIAYIGLADPPVSSASLAMTLRQRADYDTARIVVNVTEGTP